MHSKSVNTETVIGNKTSEIINELLSSQGVLQKVHPTLQANIQHFLSRKIMKYIQISVILIIIHFISTNDPSGKNH